MLHKIFNFKHLLKYFIFSVTRSVQVRISGAICLVTTDVMHKRTVVSAVWVSVAILALVTMETVVIAVRFVLDTVELLLLRTFPASEAIAVVTVTGVTVVAGRDLAEMTFTTVEVTTSVRWDVDNLYNNDSLSFCSLTMNKHAGDHSRSLTLSANAAAMRVATRRAAVTDFIFMPAFAETKREKYYSYICSSRNV